MIYLANTSIFSFISEVGTGSSSRDFDGDLMMSSLISVTQVGSNTESLQCGSLCCNVFIIQGVPEKRKPKFSGALLNN